MANTNVQAVQWANTRVRPMADLLYSAYLSAKEFKREADAKQVYGAANPIPNDATLINDGAATDGRTPLTDAQATNIYNRCVDIINWFEGSAGVSANDGTVSVGNTIIGPEVNGRSIF